MTSKINDLKTLKANSAALDAELKAVFEKYGLSMTNRFARIGGGKCEYKIELNCGVGEDSEKVERDLYNAYAKLLGLPEDGFGSVYESRGERFKITGVNPKKPKNCVKITMVRSGKAMICSPEMIKYSKKVA